MCTVLLCMISLHYSSLFSCYQLCLDGFWIFSILNIVAVDILVYVPCCLCVCFSGDASSVELLSGAYLQLCQRTSPCCPQEPVCCSPECICDRVEPHLLQYLTSSAFGIFAHWWGVKWYRPVSSFHAAFPWWQWGWSSPVTRLLTFQAAAPLNCLFIRHPLFFIGDGTRVQRSRSTIIFIMTHGDHWAVCDFVVYSYF